MSHQDNELQKVICAVISAHVFIHESDGPIISLFCITSEGESVSVNVKGFQPYFYIKIPEHSFLDMKKKEDYVKAAVAELNVTLFNKLMVEKRGRINAKLPVVQGRDPELSFCMKQTSGVYVDQYGKEHPVASLLKVIGLVEKKSFDHYRKECHPFLKVSCRLPGIMGDCRRLLAAPLGEGRNQKNGKKETLPWLTIKTAAALAGVSQQQAMTFASISDGTMKVVQKRKRPEDSRGGMKDIRNMFSQKGSFGGSSQRKEGSQKDPELEVTQESFALQTCEINIDYTMRFFVDTGLSPFGWFSFEEVTKKTNKITKFDGEYDIHISKLNVEPSIKKIPPLKVMSFDIETQPSQKNGAVTQFYKGWDLTAKLLTIGSCVHVAGTKEDSWITEVHQLDEGLTGTELYPDVTNFDIEIGEQTFQCYHFDHSHDNVPVRFFGYPSEEALFCGFVQRFFHHTPQVLTGYNVNGYDFTQMEQISCRLTMFILHKYVNEAYLNAHKVEEQVVQKVKCVMEDVNAYLEGHWSNMEEKNFKDFSFKLNKLCRSAPFLWKFNIMQTWKNVNFKKGNVLPNNFRERHQKATNTFRFNMYGIWTLDLYVYISKELKLRSYKLDSVAKEFLNAQKDDMPYSEIFDAYNTKGFEGRLKLAMYCAVDCVLVNRLMECKKIQALNKIIFMCMLTNVLPQDLQWKGTQNQLRGAILQYLKCHRNEYVLPVTDEYYVPSWHEAYDEEEDDDENDWNQPNKTKGRKPGYQGATVVDAQAGFYTSPVVVFDFASLYPSIIRELNLCCSSILWSKDQIWEEGLTEAQVITRSIGDQVLYFVDKDIFQGVIPSLLAQLKTTRSSAKKQMETYGEYAPEHAYFDGLQSSVKVAMNAIYGGFGLKKGGIFNKAYVLAALTTQRGRELIDFVKNECESKFWTNKDGSFGISDQKPQGCDQVVGVYGDSVTGDTPLLLRIDGHIVIDTIERIFNDAQYTHDRGKDISGPKYGDRVFTWSDQKWTPIRSVIRHELSSEKTIYRVTTRTGTVDVTSDHSLVLQNGEKLSTRDARVGTKLLHSFPTVSEWEYSNVDFKVTKNEAKLLGFFMANGSCDSRKTRTNDGDGYFEYSWNLVHENREKIQEYEDIANDMFFHKTEGIKFKLIDTSNFNNLIQIIPYVSNIHIGNEYDKISEFICFFESLFYNDLHQKFVPHFILNSPDLTIRSAFLEGYLDAKGCSAGESTHCITQKGKVSCMSIFTLFKSTGYQVLIDEGPTPDVFYLNAIFGKKSRRIGDGIVKISKISDEHVTYVYDLTTDNHHFNAGVGQLVVHNTDSVFMNVKHLDLKTTWKFAAMMEKHFEDLMPKPHGLELEKICLPLLLMRKKTYSSVMYMGPDHPGKTVAKGSSVVRRDQVLSVQKVTKKVQDMLMQMKSKKEIEAYVKDMRMKIIDSIRNMFVEDSNNEFSIEDFLESGSLSADKPLDQYAEGATCAVEIVRRIQRRNPDEVPEGGARVEFVIIKGENPSELKTKRARSAEEVKEGRLILDEAHYVEVFDKKIGGLLAAAYIEEENKDRLAKGTKTIDYLFGRKGASSHTVAFQPKKKSEQNKAKGLTYLEKNVLVGKKRTSDEALYVNQWDKTSGRWVRRKKEQHS